MPATRRNPSAPAGTATANHYSVLGVERDASAEAIKAAYRALVKRHHPDAGGDAQRILALNAAWEVLGDRERRRRYDQQLGLASPSDTAATQAHSPVSQGRSAEAQRGGDASGDALLGWLRQVYAPLDRLLGQVINPFPAALKALSADPYDDALMEEFCGFLEQSRQRLDRAEALYRSKACPDVARGFGLSLYHCLGQVQDALAELERYTLGYVDNYLHDGREMLREARRQRQRLQEERRRLPL